MYSFAAAPFVVSCTLHCTVLFGVRGGADVSMPFFCLERRGPNRSVSRSLTCGKVSVGWHDSVPSSGRLQLVPNVDALSPILKDTRIRYSHSRLNIGCIFEFLIKSLFFHLFFLLLPSG